MEARLKRCSFLRDLGARIPLYRSSAPETRQDAALNSFFRAVDSAEEIAEGRRRRLAESLEFLPLENFMVLQSASTASKNFCPPGICTRGCMNQDRPYRVNFYASSHHTDKLNNSRGPMYVAIQPVLSLFHDERDHASIYSPMSHDWGPCVFDERVPQTLSSTYSLSLSHLVRQWLYIHASVFEDPWDNLTHFFMHVVSVTEVHSPPVFPRTAMTWQYCQVPVFFKTECGHRGVFRCW